MQGKKPIAAVVTALSIAAPAVAQPAAPPAPAKPAPATPPGAPATPPKPGDKTPDKPVRLGAVSRDIRFQFDGMPYTEVVRIFAQMANKPLVGDLNIEGTLTFFDSEPYTYNEAFETLNVLLAMKGYQLVETDRYLQLVAIKDIPRMPLPILHGMEEAKDIPQGQIVTVMLPLKFADSTMAAKALAPMVSSFGTVAPLARGKGIVITDRLANIQRLRGLLKELDIEQITEQQMKTVRIKAGSARDIAGILNNLFGAVATSKGRTVQRDGQEQRVDAPQQLFATFDERTNSLILIGGAEQVAMAEQMIEKLDLPEAGAAPGVSGVLRIFALKSARAEDVAKTISQALPDKRAQQQPAGRGTPPPAMPARIIADAATNRLVVSASAEQMKEIEQLIKDLDQATVEMGGARVFQLKTADAGQLAGVVAAAVTDIDSRGQAIPKIRVNADTRSNLLIVSGPAGDINRAEKLIEELDRPLDKEAREVRVVQLKAGEAAQLSQSLQRLFAQQQQPGKQPTGTALRVEADQATNSLIISAAPGDWPTINKILEDLKASAIPNVVPSTRQIPMQNVKASEIAGSLREIFNSRPRGPRSVPVAISFSDRANSLLVSAAEDDQQVIADLVKSMDIPAGDAKFDKVHIVTLKGADAARLAETLRAMLPAQAKATQDIAVMSDPLTNSVIIRAPDAQRQMMEDMIAKLDQAIVDSARETRLVPIAHTSASAIVPMLNQIFAQPAQQRPGGARPNDADQRIVITAAPGDKALVVDAPRNRFQQIAQLVQSLDVDQAPGQVQVRSYQIANSRSWELAPALARLFAQQQRPSAPTNEPQPRFEADVATNQLLISATTSQFGEIEPLLKKLDAAGVLTSQTKTFPLKSARAAEVAGVLQSILSDATTTGGLKRGQSGGFEQPVRVAALHEVNAVVVQATPEKLAQAEQLITSIDTPQAAAAASTIQIVQLTNSQCVTLAQSLNQTLTEQVQAAARPGQPINLADRVSVTPEVNSNSLFVRGPAERVASVVEMIKKLDAAGTLAGQTKTFPLKFARAAEVVPVLTAMLADDPTPAGQRRSAQGAIVTATRVAAMAETNTIVVQGPTEKLAMAEQLIKTFDTEQAASSSAIQIVHLKNAQATTLAASLNAALAETPGQPQRPGQQQNNDRVTVTPEINSNSILIKGPSERIPGVVEMIKKLDEQSNSTSAQVRVYPLTNGQAPELAKSLTTLFQDITRQQAAAAGSRGTTPPPFTATADARTNTLVVSTTPAHFALVEELLKSLDQAPRATGQNVSLITLKNAIASDVVTKLKAMYADRRGADKPVIEADEYANAVTIIANDTDLKAIEPVVAKLDDAAKDTSLHVRVIPLTASNAEQMAQVVRSVYSQMSGAKVNIAEKVGDKPKPEGKINPSYLQQTIYTIAIAAQGAPEAAPAADAKADPAPDVTIAVDKSSNAIIVSGTRQDIDNIESLIRQLTINAARGDAEYRVFKIGKADPSAIASTLDELYNPKPVRVVPGQDPRTIPPSPPPVIAVVADAPTHSVIVRAKPQDFEVIEQLIKHLDQASDLVSELKVFTLKNTEAADVAANLRELFSPAAGGGAQPQPAQQPGAANAQGRRAAQIRAAVAANAAAGNIKPEAASAVSVTANRQSNSVVVAAPAPVMELISDIVQELDQSAATSATPVVRMYPVKNAEVRAVVTAVQEIFTQPAGRGPQGAQREAPVIVSADDGGSQLIISAPASKHELIAKVIGDIDKAQQGGQATVKVYALRHAEAPGVANALSAAMVSDAARGGQPGRGGSRGGSGPSPLLRITADASSNALVVRATADDHKRVAELVEQLDAAPAQAMPVKMIALKNADAATVAQTLTRLFGAAAGPGGARGGAQANRATVAVEADRASRTLMVRADEQTFEKIKAMAMALDAASPGDELQQSVVQLKRAQASSVAAAITPVFAPPRGKPVGPEDAVTVVAEPVSNSLVVTASKANMAKVNSLIEKLDGETAEGMRTELMVLKKGKATELAGVLQRVAGTTGAARPGQTQSVVVTADAGSNALVMSGPGVEVNKLMAMATQLDQVSNAATTGVYILPLKNGDAVSVAAMVRDLYNQQAQAAQRQQKQIDPLAVSADERANAIVVATSKAMHEQVSQWVTQVETMKPERGTLRVINIQNADPAEVDKAIREMFGPKGQAPGGQGGSRGQGQGGRPGSGGKPGAQGGAGTGGAVETTVLPQQKSILISATDEDFAAIQKLVEGLDGAAVKAKPQVKVFQLKFAHTQRITDALNQMFRPVPGRPPAPEEQVSVTPLLQADAVAVTAAPKRLEEVEKIIEQLDQPAVAKQVEFRVFQLTNVQPSRVMPLLQQMLQPLRQERPNEPIQVSSDERTKSVIVGARANVFDQIGKMIETLDKAPTAAKVEVMVVPLKKADATRLAAVLNEMLQPSPTGAVTPEARLLQEEVKRLRLRRAVGVASDTQPADDLPDLDLTKPIKITADPGQQGSNSLVVQSTPDNLKAMRAVIDLMDSVPLAEGVRVKLVRLQNADAQSVATILQQIFQQGKTLAGKPGTGGVGRAEPDTLTGKALVNPLNVSADPRTNTLVMSGGEESIALADIVIKDLDHGVGELVTEVKLFKLKHADATRLLPVLQSVFAEAPATPGTEGLRTQVTRLRTAEGKGKSTELPRTRAALTIQADPVSQIVIVAARSDVMPLIEDVVKTMDVPGAAAANTVRIFPLTNADAARVKQVLDNLYTGPTAQQIRPEDRPTISVDTRTNALVINGSEKSFAVIESMFKQLDAKTPIDLQGVRLIALKNAEAGALARSLQQMLDARVARLTAAGGKEADAAKVVVMADPRSNSLMVSASAEGFDLVKQLAAQLDGASPALSADVQLIPLKQANAGQLSATLQRLFDQRYAATPSVPGAADASRQKPIIMPDLRTNSLMVACSADDTRVLQGLLERLDVALAAPTVKLEVIPLKHNDAGAIAPMIQNMFQSRLTAMTPPGQTPAPQDRVDVNVDTLTNSLVISSSAENLGLIKGLLEKVDVQPPTETGIVRLFPLKASDAQRVATMLQGLLSQGLYKPGIPIAGQNAAAAQREKVAITTDLRTNVVIVSASKENFAVIEEIIKGIDVPGDLANGDVKVYSLSRADASRLAPTLQNFFNAKRTAETAAGGTGRSLAVSIIADQRTNSLLVSGSKESFTAMDGLVQKLDGTQALPLNEFRVFILKNASAGGLQPMIQQLFDQRALRDDTRKNQATVVSDPRTNALIVGALPDDLEMAEALVKKLDVEPEQPGMKVAVFPLVKADALSITNTLRSIFAAPAPPTPGSPGQPTAVGTPNSTWQNPVVNITADVRLNAVVVSAQQADIDRVAELVRQLDGETNPKVTEIKVFPLHTADAAELATVLTTAIKSGGVAPGGPAGGGQNVQNNGAPGQIQLQFLTRSPDGQALVSTTLQNNILITPDKRTNSVVVSAAVENMELIESLIKAMDSPSPQAAQIRVFRLQNADGRAMADVLSQLFKLQAAGGANARAFSYTLVTTTQPADAAAAPTTQPSAAGPVTLGTAEQAALSITVDSRTNTLLVSGTKHHIDLVSDVIRELDSSPAQERVSQIYRPRNAQAVDIQTALRTFLDQERQRLTTALGNDKLGAAQRLLDREVAIVAEKTTNTLLISGSPRYYETISKMVKELDQPQPQVLIQVLLAEIQLDNELDLGSQWSVTKSVGSYNGLAGTNLGLISSAASGASATAGTGTTSGSSGSSGTSSTASSVPAVPALNGFSLAVTGGDVRFVLRALQTQGKLEVLSRPQILASDNIPAEINVGQRVPLITASRVSGDTATPVIVNTITYQDIGVGLKVTPRINPDGFVKLEVEPRIENIANSTVDISPGTKAVIINQRRATTTVTVQDGHTIIIGGLITRIDNATESKVPLLGDIPLIGYLFKDTKKTKNRNELLVILTPHVLRDPSEADRISSEQVKKLDALKDIKGIGGTGDRQFDTLEQMRKPAPATKTNEAGELKQIDPPSN